jgi:hypothetical protein
LRQRRGRIQRLEEEIAQARAERADLRQRLQMFEMIAAAAGVGEPDPLPGTPSAAVPGGAVPAPLPVSLIAAAHERRARHEPVWLEVGDSDVIAVVGGSGDPREWWSAIWHTGKQAGDAS